MKTRCESYLSDGTILKDKEAFDHLKSKLENYEKVIADVDHILSRSLKNNHIVEEDTLPNTVMFTAEALSIIQIDLDLLLERMPSVLEKS
ncbi:hypothetical protein [uncultured Traorella sp.]|uniref:hypothetical protein n=1 Tax=uncultured Traorella sp. TaxID=1929048 RepID=UPI0025F7C488|nr:hypothetical protein [uncultured Traorella sp.]